MESIQLKEVLKEMAAVDHEGKPVYFDLTIRTFNRQNGRGGKTVHYKNVRLLKPGSNHNEIGKLKRNVKEKNPNHWANRTRNIKLMNNEIKKINTLFIIKFNGLNVYY